MNKRSHLHKKADSSASNPVLSQFQSRPNICQTKPQSQKPLTQTQTENQEFQQQKFEATKLEIQEKYGTITPEGQEQLTVLQAKMSGLLQRRLEHASSKDSNFANIPISRPDVPSKLAVQTKLTIGEPGDKYEREADRVAAQVVNQIHAPVSQQAGQNVQREEISDEEKELQMKPMLQLRAAVGGMTATGDLERGIQQARGGGQPLAANIRQPMEQAFGADFSKVKVHTDTKADQLNQSIQAKAFTTGQDVFFRKGEYNPGSRGGQELLAHELTHVVQQSGAVQGKQMTGAASIKTVQRTLDLKVDQQELKNALEAYYKEGGKKFLPSILRNKVQAAIKSAEESLIVFETKEEVVEWTRSEDVYRRNQAETHEQEASSSAGGEESRAIEEAGESPIIVEKNGTKKAEFKISGLINCVGVVLHLYASEEEQKPFAAVGGHFVTPIMYEPEQKTFKAPGAEFIKKIKELIKKYPKANVTATYYVKASAVAGGTSRAREEGLQAANAIKSELGYKSEISETSDTVYIVI